MAEPQRGPEAKESGWIQVVSLASATPAAIASTLELAGSGDGCHLSAGGDLTVTICLVAVAALVGGTWVWAILRGRGGHALRLGPLATTLGALSGFVLQYPIRFAGLFSIASVSCHWPFG